MQNLIIHDRNSSFLIDTEADISVILKAFANKRHVRAKFQIYAANGTAITTYDERRLKLNLRLRREFEWTFIIADVQQPILGADFLKHFGLFVDIRG